MNKYLDRVLNALAILSVMGYLGFVASSQLSAASYSTNPCESGTRVKLCNSSDGVVVSTRSAGHLCNVIISTGSSDNFVRVLDSGTASGSTVPSDAVALMPALFASSNNVTVSNLLGPVKYLTGLTCHTSGATAPAWIYYKPD